MFDISNYTNNNLSNRNDPTNIQLNFKSKHMCDREAEIAFAKF